jgi:hypothetical protein
MPLESSRLLVSERQRKATSIITAADFRAKKIKDAGR